MRKESASPQELLHFFEIYLPQVDVRRICLDLEINVDIAPSMKKGASGELEVDEHNGAATIRVLAEDPEPYQRFTMAHELGHLMCRHPVNVDGKKHIDISYSGNVHERQANTYAESLLVPLSFLDKYAANHAFDSQWLAHAFNVSPTVMSIRLTKWHFYRLNYS